MSSNSKILASRDPWTPYEPADTLALCCGNQYNDGLHYLVTANVHNRTTSSSHSAKIGLVAVFAIGGL